MAERRDDDRLSPIVPPDFEVPRVLETPSFRLEPLGVEHNGSDHAAWMSSIDHIRSTPGFIGRTWPEPMTLEENASDLQMHADHFDARVGFTYTVLETDSEQVVGCVYIYGDDASGADATADVHVRSWVRADRAELDIELWRAVSAWLDEDWPFGTVRYASREG